VTAGVFSDNETVHTSAENPVLEISIIEKPINQFKNQLLIHCSKDAVACQNATIRLAGVGGPRDPTIARGTIRSLLKDLELAR
jgi:hypothetical protein